MDASRAHLSRLVQAAAMHRHEYNNNAGGGDSVGSYYYYRADCSGKGEGGDTTPRYLPPVPALHRLVALHTTTAASLDEFLDKQQQQSRRIHQQHHNILFQQDEAGATALHVALHRNSWHCGDLVRTMLLRASNGRHLAATPMQHGRTYPLHVVTGQSLTIDPNVFDLLLAAAPQVAACQDALGDTPLSLLYQNVLRFRWAREWEQGRQCRNHRRDSYYSDGSSSSYNNGGAAAAAASSPSTSTTVTHKDLSCMTIIAPDQFLDCALRLVEAQQQAQQHAHNILDRETGAPDCCQYNNNKQQLSWHAICATDRCPPLLIRMLLHQQLWLDCNDNSCSSNSNSASSSLVFRECDENGRLPLHCAAAAQAVSCLHLPADCARQHQTVLELVLAAYPNAATVADRTGRWPLHYAVSNPSLMVYGKDDSRPEDDADVQKFGSSSSSHLQAVLLLARTYPTALTVPDPVTGLYPVMQLAATLRGKAATAEEEDTTTTSELGVLYQLLHSNPSVCNFHLEGV